MLVFNGFWLAAKKKGRSEPGDGGGWAEAVGAENALNGTSLRRAMAHEQPETLAGGCAVYIQVGQRQCLADAVGNLCQSLRFGQAVALHMPTPQAIRATLGLRAAHIAVLRMRRRGGGFAQLEVVLHTLKPWQALQALQRLHAAVQSQHLAQVLPIGGHLRKAHTDVAGAQLHQRAVQLGVQGIEQVCRAKLWVGPQGDVDVVTGRHGINPRHQTHRHESARPSQSAVAPAAALGLSAASYPARCRSRAFAWVGDRLCLGWSQSHRVLQR